MIDRRMVAATVVVGWVATIGWLVSRETSGPGGDRLDDALRTVEPGAMYYRVALGTTQVGFASNTVDTVPDGLLVQDRLSLEVPTMGAVQRTELVTVARLSNTLRLLEFEAGLVGDIGRFAATGWVDGDSLLRVQLDGDETTDIRIPLAEPIVLPAYLPIRVAFGGELRVGNRYAVKSFDPLLLESREVSVEVLADSVLFVPDSAAYDTVRGRWVVARMDTVPAWHIAQTINGIATEAWIDQFGRIVSARSPVGVSLERTAFEIAFFNFRDRDRAASQAEFAVDIVPQTPIEARVAPDPEREELRVVVRGLEATGLDFGGGYQTWQADTLTVRRAPAGALDPDYRLPAVGPALNRYITPDPLIQSDDPRVSARARLVIDRTRNPRRATNRLVGWVQDNLEPQPIIAAPSAVQVLDHARGDVSEHTLLFVALARAVGLPARPVSGLLYAGNRFYYHAWAEVYLGEWVPVDPTFGAVPADASRIRIATGTLARRSELIRLIGGLSLDVVAEGDPR